MNEMKDIKIKEGFNDEDAELIFRLEHELAKEESFTDEKEGQAFLKDIYSLEKIKKWKDDFVFTIWNGKNFVGFGRAKKDGWITHINIKKEYQGKGIGSTMLTILENLLKEKDFKEIFLNSRPEVLEFYVKHGWIAKEAEPINYHGILLIPMLKKLQ